MHMNVCNSYQHHGSYHTQGPRHCMQVPRTYPTTLSILALAALQSDKPRK